MMKKRYIRIAFARAIEALGLYRYRQGEPAMADDSDVRDNFKTVRYSDSEYRLIMEAASQTRQANPSKVIRDGALAHARQIVQAAESTAEEKREKLHRRLQAALSNS